MNASLNFLRVCTSCLLLPAGLAIVLFGQPTLVPGQKESSDPERERGMRREEKPGTADRYREKWAVIIGINYKGRPPSNGLIDHLENAEKDAQSVRDILVCHYGYRPENIKLLLGSKATGPAIRSILGGELLGDRSKVQENDSVLVFFAGHGACVSSRKEQRGVIFPFDVRKQEQIPEPDHDSVLFYNNDIVPLLNDCPARHKLLILNCCHAGEVFSEKFPQSSPVELRRELSFFRRPAFQALASSQANELESDGSSKEANSPFTASLVHAFQMIPNQAERREYFTATELFDYMVGDFGLRQKREQSPSLRSLIPEDGEFRFHPAPDSNFDQYRETDINMELLRAMVPGEYGNWWFDETPWFIPSLRMTILANKKSDIKRGPYVDAISRKELMKAATAIVEELERRPDKDLLAKLRLAHLRVLLESAKSRDFRTLRETMIKKLKERKDLLKATDFHLLAVLQHSLGFHEAGESYQKALKEYEAERTGIIHSDQQKKAKKENDNKALHALCLADFGYYKLDEQNECEQAATLFSEASEKLGPLEAPPPFLIFLLCREADALQGLGRWGLALERLGLALHNANRIDPEIKSSLRAHILNRRGWALMEQWRFKEAKEDFKLSEEILQKLLKEDPIAEILSFHNKHGLAMAERFQGDSRKAAKQYRELVNNLAKWFDRKRLGANTHQNVSEIHERLRERWFDSMERLVDCNLFGDPSKRDLREASDDLRRTIRSCFMMPVNQRTLIEAGLAYKQAIILSLRSPAQDLPLAASYCKRASALLESLPDSQKRLLDFQSKLAPPIVELFITCAEKPDGLESKRAALAKLRAAVEELRERWKNNDHRDYLEFHLFAGKILVEEAIDADRYETLMDSEMLLGFCRRALRGKSGESLSYLRPYYDAVMETKLRLKPRHVKDLLEVQWEATQGTTYRKTDQLQLVMALYHLKDRHYLLLDIPGGASAYYCLQDDYSHEEIDKALVAGTDQLELPREIVRQLQKLPPLSVGERNVQCLPDQVPGSLSKHSVGYVGGPQQQFPFKLPRGFKILPTVTDSQTSFYYERTWLLRCFSFTPGGELP